MGILHCVTCAPLIRLLWCYTDFDMHQIQHWLHRFRWFLRWLHHRNCRLLSIWLGIYRQFSMSVVWFLFRPPIMPPQFHQIRPSHRHRPTSIGLHRFVVHTISMVLRMMFSFALPIEFWWDRASIRLLQRDPPSIWVAHCYRDRWLRQPQPKKKTNHQNWLANKHYAKNTIQISNYLLQL